MKRVTMSRKRIGSAELVKRSHKTRILVAAVRLDADASSKRGLFDLSKFVRIELPVRLEDHVLIQILKSAVVISPQALNLEQKMVLLKEADKLNGTRHTEEGLKHLRCFAAIKWDALIGEELMRHIINEKLPQPIQENPTYYQEDYSRARSWSGSVSSRSSARTVRTCRPT